MPFARKKNAPRARAVHLGIASVALALAGGLLTAPQAMAASAPTNAELLAQCATADLCAFHPQSYTTYIGPEHQVGATAYNCASTAADHAVSWSDTTGETNSVGVSISVSAKFWQIYEASVEASYGHDWTVSHTDTETDTVHVPTKYAGWITRGTSKQQATGWYEFHFAKPYYDHYYWYIYDYTSSGFNVDNPNAGYIATHDRAMTSAERSAHGC